MINASDIEAFEYYNELESGNVLPTDYQTFIHKSRYSKWLPEELRRENWAETVDRYMKNIVGDKLDTEVYSEIRQAILDLEIMPSMRAMMTAGAAADRDNTCIYNCSYLPVDDPKSFDEAMFILLCGTGVGFSVERQYINKLQSMTGVILILSLELIHVVKLYSGRISSVILRKLLSGLEMTWILLREKSGLQRYLEQFSPHILSSHICERCGSEIPKKNDCWVCHSQG